MLSYKAEATEQNKMQMYLGDMKVSDPPIQTIPKKPMKLNKYANMILELEKTSSWKEIKDIVKYLIEKSRSFETIDSKIIADSGITEIVLRLSSQNSDLVLQQRSFYLMCLFSMKSQEFIGIALSYNVTSLLLSVLNHSCLNLKLLALSIVCFMSHSFDAFRSFLDSGIFELIMNETNIIISNFDQLFIEKQIIALIGVYSMIVKKHMYFPKNYICSILEIVSYSTRKEPTIFKYLSEYLSYMIESTEFCLLLVGSILFTNILSMVFSSEDPSIRQIINQTVIAVCKSNNEKVQKIILKHICVNSVFQHLKTVDVGMHSFFLNLATQISVFDESAIQTLYSPENEIFILALLESGSYKNKYHSTNFVITCFTNASKDDKSCIVDSVLFQRSLDVIETLKGNKAYKILKALHQLLDSLSKSGIVTKDLSRMSINEFLSKIYQITETFIDDSICNKMATMIRDDFFPETIM